MFRHLRAAAFALSVICAFLTAPVSGQSLQWIANLSGWSGWGALEHGNGDKVVVGRFNTLHTVWEAGGLIKYSTSIDGYNWSSPELVAPGLPAAMPAIASDSNGTLVVAFVANPDADGLGTIRYARKAWGAASWTQNQIVDSGTQPDIDARAGRAHVVWTTFDRVQYTTFQVNSPPASMSFGEEIEVSACPNTGFIRPSVALPRESCKLAPKVAYLRYSDETTNPNPACTSLVTEVGPRVCARDETNGTWGLEYSDLVSQTNPALGVEAISLSMNADYKYGHTFLAWSDSSNGAARTRVAHGRAGSWNAITHDAVERHAHVTAKRHSSNGEFRLAWVSKNGLDTFVDWDASFRTGTWQNGSSPSWSAPATLITNATSNNLGIGRPQATFWGRCSGGNYETVEAVAEVEGACSTTRLMNHFTGYQTCPSAVAIGLIDPCQKIAVAYTYSGHEATRVDTSGLGQPSYIGDRYVEFAFETDDGLSRVFFEWDRGKIVEVGEEGFVINDPKAQVRLASEGVRAKLQKLPANPIYDEMELLDDEMDPRQGCEDG